MEFTINPKSEKSIERGYKGASPKQLVFDGTVSKLDGKK